MPTPRLERNLTASFASVDYRRKHGAGVMHTLGRDLPFANRRSRLLLVRCEEYLVSTGSTAPGGETPERL